jgi:hypothetical protein
MKKKSLFYFHPGFMLYLFVTTMSALHAFNLIHPKIIKTNCKEAILLLLPLQTRKLFAGGLMYLPMGGDLFVSSNGDG